MSVASVPQSKHAIVSVRGVAVLNSGQDRGTSVSLPESPVDSLPLDCSKAFFDPTKFPERGDSNSLGSLDSFPAVKIPYPR